MNDNVALPLTHSSVGMVVHKWTTTVYHEERVKSIVGGCVYGWINAPTMVPSRSWVRHLVVANLTHGMLNLDSETIS